MPTATALDVRSLLAGLAAAGVDHVLTGSVAAAAYGVPVEPNDLDVAPSLAEADLARLARVLAARWTPEPAAPENLDHLFDTGHGRFDVVPARSGTYDELAPRALNKPKHRRRAPQLELLCERSRGGEGPVPSLDPYEEGR